MQFLTAANKKHTFFVQQTIKSLDILEYPYTVYDLGGLGFGEKYDIQNDTFQNYGYYKTNFKLYNSTGIHKPHIILNF